jgi:ABC-2 type transport system ATP-binding protein
VRELGADHAVVLSTHVLPDVVACCDRVAILHEGALRHEGALDREGDALNRTFMAIATGAPAVAA